MRRWHITSEQIRHNCARAVMEIMGDDNYDVVIEEHKEDKTDAQRGFWHVLCKLLGNEIGYSQLEVKELIKAETFGETTVTIGGITREVVNSSELAKRDEYSQLIETTYRIAAFEGVQLPPARYNG